MSTFLLNARFAVAFSLASGMGFFTFGASVTPAEACDPNPYIGSICWTAQNYCPRDYYPAKGGIDEIANNNALFALIGTNFDGNGVTTYGLPNLSGREMIGTGEGPGLSRFYIGQLVWKEFLYPSIQALPQHNHVVDFRDATISGPVGVASQLPATSTTPSLSVWGVPGRATNLYSTSSNTTMAEDMVDGTVAYNDVQTGHTPEKSGEFAVSTGGPKLGLTACIAIDGQFPPRPSNNGN